MLTVNDIINISFNKSNFGGYKTEDVDVFIDEVKESYELLIKKNIEQKEANESLAEENKKLLKKISLLAKRVEEYRQEENEIKNALISAQKLSEAAIREARHKAEIVIKDATIKADEKVTSVDDEVEAKKEELEKMRQIVSDFRKMLLDKYKEHLTLINNIPNRKKPSKIEAPAALEADKETQSKELHTRTLEEHIIEKTPQVNMKSVVSEKHEKAEKENTSNELLKTSKGDVSSERTSFIEVEEVDRQPTKSFKLQATGFEKEPDEKPGRDLRYDVLQFGENYHTDDKHDEQEGASSKTFKRKK